MALSGWVGKEALEARYTGAEEAERMLKQRKLNGWPQNKRRKAQYKYTPPPS